MDDITKRLRQYGITGEPLLLQDDAILEEAADEIERLRLTDEERAALEYGIRQADEYDRVGIEDAKRAAIVFRGLLKRLG